MIRAQPLGAAAVRFRTRIIDALEADGRRIGYVDADKIDARCPVCGGILCVSFAGSAARADLKCLGGCSEAEVAERLAGRSA
jgi:hypothetical protein